MKRVGGHARIAKHIMGLKRDRSDMDEELMYNRAKGFEDAGMLDEDGGYMGEGEDDEPSEAGGMEMAVAVVVPSPKQVLTHLVELEKKGLIELSNPKMQKLKASCEELQTKREEICQLEESLSKELKSMPEMASMMGDGEY